MNYIMFIVLGERTGNVRSKRKFALLHKLRNYALTSDSNEEEQTFSYDFLEVISFNNGVYSIKLYLDLLFYQHFFL